MTKHELQNYSAEKDNKIALDKYTDTIVSHILLKVYDKITNNIGAHVIKQRQYKYVINPNAIMHVKAVFPDICLVQILIDKLREKLPDSIILSDPLKTYILIDWS